MDMLDDLKLIHTRDTADLLGQADKYWQAIRDESWLPTVAMHRNYAKQLALEMLGRSVVIATGPELAEVAQHWKVSINRYAKQLAWVSDIMNDDDLIAWTGQPTEKLYSVIDLRGPLDSLEVTRRFARAERLLSGTRPAPVIITVPAIITIDMAPEWLRALGTFVALYTAIASGIDPNAFNAFSAKLNQET